MSLIRTRYSAKKKRDFSDSGFKALGKGKFMKNKKQKVSLIVLFGIFVAAIGVILILVEQNLIFEANEHVLYEERNRTLSRETDYLKKYMLSYKSLPWLMEYWHDNYSSMDIERNALYDKNSRWYKAHKEYDDMNVKELTGADAEKLSEEEAKLFAEYCYEDIANAFNVPFLKDSDSLISFSHYQGEEKSSLFVYFTCDKEIPDGEEGSQTNYFLGEEYPIDINRYPTCKAMYEKGASE